MNKIAILINPIAGGGRGKKAWRILQPALQALFDEVIYRVSNDVDDLAELTRALLEENPSYFLIVGGDGTLNHCLNGLIKDDQLKNPELKVAYFNAGCGGDFARQFPPQKITEFLDRLMHNQSCSTNIGKINYANEGKRYFINIASCGLSGQVVLSVAKSGWLKKLGGPVNYSVHSLLGLLRFSRSQVRIQIDDNQAFDCSLLMMAACNGQFFAGRMRVAPLAKVDDGLMDIVLFQDFTKMGALFKLRKIYSGGHLLEKNVHYVQAKKVRIESLQSQDVLIEADGEAVGALPATYMLLPDKLSLIV